MSITPLNSHYSMENPASVYDEEALTSLELAGRVTAKVNQTVEAFNALETRNERWRDQQTAMIPVEIGNQVENHIESGEFDNSINRYAGDLITQLANLLGMVTPGTTSRDAEVMDIRTGWDGKGYANAGDAVRNSQVSAIYVNSANYKTVLSDLDHADHPRYLFNFAKGTSTDLPANLPFNSIPDVLFQLDVVKSGEYSTQVLSVNGRFYYRFGVAGNFYEWHASDQLVETITSSDYLKKLPDVNHASLPLYFVNFAQGATEIPDNLPFESAPATLFQLKTWHNKTFMWQEITFHDRETVYRRWGLKTSGNWMPWETLYAGRSADGVRTIVVASGESILKGLRDAYSTNAGRVIVEAGDYDILADYQSVYGPDYFNNYAGYQTEDKFDRGLWLEDIELIFSPGSRVTCHYTGDNATVKTDFSAFACGNNVVIDGLVLDASNVRYGIHPDYNTGTELSTMVIRNCDLHFIKGSNQQAIGAGFGVHVDWLVENTIFRSEMPTHVVRIHNNVSPNACSRALFRNCYIDGPGHFKFNNYSTSPHKSRIMVSGCSYINPPVVGFETGADTVENMELVTFNNETRTK